MPTTSLISDKYRNPTEPISSRRQISSFRTLRALSLCIAIAVFSAAGCGAHDVAPPDNSSSATTEQAIRFTSGDISLAGTLIIPPGSQKHPAVVLFQGSGPEARNLSMARWFASQGFAAITYDKRGVGESTGNFRVVPFMNLCDDGLAAIAYLKSRKEINATHIGVWGQSQGGWLGPLAASRSSDVAFVIAASGPAVSPGEQMLFYFAQELEAKGLSEKDVREATSLRRDIWNYFATGNGYDQVEAEIKQARSTRWYDDVKSQSDNLFDGIQPPSASANKPATKFNWSKQEMNYDPVPALEALHVPALFVFAGDDRLVPVTKSVEVIRAVLARDSTKDFTITILPNDNHGMYLPSGTFDPKYLETMQTWLSTRSKASH